MTAASMAMNVEKGNLRHGISGKQGDVKQWNESGKTCIYPVAKITPEANALTIANGLLSGWSIGMAREKRGRRTPIMLATKMEAMAMSLSLRDLALSWQPCSSWDWHWELGVGVESENDGVKKEKRKRRNMSAWSFRLESMMHKRNEELSVSLNLRDSKCCVKWQ